MSASADAMPVAAAEELIALAPADKAPRDKPKPKTKKLPKSLRKAEKRKQMAASHIPWLRQEYSKDPGLALHEEVVDFVQYIEATPAERAARSNVVSRIRAVVKKTWPKARVDVLGSMRSDLLIPESDIDLVVHGDWPMLPLRTMASCLSVAKIPKDIRVISKARVPIIKLRDGQTSLDVDISFNLPDGPLEAESMKENMQSFPLLRPLTLIIKQFLAQRQLNEVFTGGLGSYAVYLLGLSFFQLHPRKSRGGSNLGVVLLEFLELYGLHFDYVNVGIRVTDGGSYFVKDGAFFKEYRPHLLAIENPRVAGHDVTAGSFQIQQIQQSFAHAYHVLASCFSADTPWNGTSMLARILTINDEINTYRAWINENFDTPPITSLSSRKVRADPRASKSAGKGRKRKRGPPERDGDDTDRHDSQKRRRKKIKNKASKKSKKGGFKK